MKRQKAGPEYRRATRGVIIAAVGLSILLASMFLLGIARPTHAVNLVDDDPPRIGVNYSHDWVRVKNQPSVEVKVQLSDKAVVTGATGEDGWFGSYEWPWTPDHPSIVPGDVATVTIEGSILGVVQVGEIESELDFDGEIISGTINAPWLSPGLVRVSCEIWEEQAPDNIDIEDVNPDGGRFTCDFGTEGWDLQSSQMVAVRYQQADGNSVISNPEAPRIQVNYGHNWVDVRADPSAPVKVSVNDTAYVEGTTGEDGRFESGQGTWTPDQPHIKPGDIISAWVDSEILGVVEVGEIESVFDFDADVVAGTINAPSLGSALVDVRCDIWEEVNPGEVKIEDVAADGGSYTCDFKTVGWDLKPDQTVAVSYKQPDGHEVINNPSAPWVRVNYAHDWVGANYETGHTFVITVTDSTSSIKGIAQTDSVPGGGWGGDGFETQGEDWTPDQPDIEPGDLVYVSADDGFGKIVRVGEIRGTIDLENDSISGPIYADWFTEMLDVECQPWGAWPDHVDSKRSTAKPDGTVPYSCDWKDEWDVLPGKEIAVFYLTPGTGDIVGNVLQTSATRYVAKTGSDDDDNRCLDPAKPCRTIDHAKNRARSGDELWVAEGTYLERLNIHNMDLTVRGGYTASGTEWIPHTGKTIIDGNQDGNVVILNQSNVTIENLAVTGGRTENEGAGIAIYNGADVMLVDVQVFANTSLQAMGGGIAAVERSTVTIVDSIIYANTAEQGEGGGIAFHESTVNLIGSRIVANVALNNEGGGIAAERGLLNIDNSIIAGNKSATSGGGVWTFGEEPTLIVNSHIVGNEASNEGGAVATKDAARVVMTNTLIISNTGTTGIADRDGSGSTIHLSYCDTYGNSPDGTSGVTITRDNCIGSPASAGLDPQMAGGTLPAGTGPNFAAAWIAYGYHPSTGSPAIDSGSNAGAPNTDIAGSPRPQDGDLNGTAVVDMGAYESNVVHVYLPVAIAE